MSLELTQLGIHLKVADITKSRAFYDSLGFKPVFVYGDQDFLDGFPKKIGKASEKYRGITYQISETTQFEIADGHIAVPDKSVFKQVIETPKISAMVRVKSVVPLFDNPLVKIKFPVRHYYWGTIEVALRDPDGFVLIFIAPYSAKEYEKVSKYVKIETIKP